MNCREVRLLISPYLDGELSPGQADALDMHTAACVECNREMTLYWQISGLLKSAGREEIQVPPDFHNRVMSKIRPERRHIVAKLPPTLRRALSAAAVVLLLAGGTAWVSSGFNLVVGGSKIIGYEMPIEQQVNVPGANSTSGVNNQNETNGRPAGRTPAPEADNHNNSSPSTTIDDKDPSITRDAGVDSRFVTDIGGAVTMNSLEPAQAGHSNVLLSDSIKVTSTRLVIAADDLDLARAKALELAAGARAVTQLFPEQAGNNRLLAMRLIVVPDNASGLITGLHSLGNVIDKQDEVRDLTTQYNETYTQYRELLASKTGAGNSGGQQMEDRTTALKQQLDNWDAEAGKQVIVLWLEGK